MSLPSMTPLLCSTFLTSRTNNRNSTKTLEERRRARFQRLPAAAAVCDTTMYELNTARVLTLPEVDMRSLGQA